MLALAAGASVLTLIVTAADPTSGGLMMAALLAIVAVAAGWALSTWNPPTIAIRDGVLEVASRRRETKIDLRDPNTQVELGDKPGSPSWRAVVKPPEGRDVVIRAQQVKARQFSEIVQHHRKNLREEDEVSRSRTTADPPRPTLRGPVTACATAWRSGTTAPGARTQAYWVRPGSWLRTGSNEMAWLGASSSDMRSSAKACHSPRGRHQDIS